ncbi:MAG: 3-dehydroquinate synthase [Anaerolineaceae bacterium 4572_5.2]|nr:MAG: 3-dehydroquinate synthase [Anaerolineaceae bacterium 4572_5.2]
MDSVQELWNAFLEAKIERGSTVVALGGGVVGDLAGFAAATFLRGVNWVNVPTSLLAMVDSSLGGKTGADLPQGKNLVGAFHAPRLVLVDPETLSTLPEVELRNGLAEVIKHGVIGAPELFRDLTDLTGFQNLSGLSGLDWTEIVRRAMAVKIKIIEEDPYEQGLRQSLNFGHTIGHAVELASDFTLRHGEAVAIGMVAEARLAEEMGVAKSGLEKKITSTLRGLGLPTEIPPGLDEKRIQHALQRDKKKSGGVVRFALPVRVGEVRVGVEVRNLPFR